MFLPIKHTLMSIHPILTHKDLNQITPTLCLQHLKSTAILITHYEMGVDNEQSPTVRLQMAEQSNSGSDAISIKLSDNWGSTLFEPQSEPGDTNPVASPSTDQAPEKKLTLFALRLAVLEKSASGLGALSFIWATVVLLGGFAITLQREDFWFITIILLIEGTRIFSRSHELEWQHQATWSITGAGMYSFRALRSTSHQFLRAARLTLRPFSIVEIRRGQSLSDDMRATEPISHDVPTARIWNSFDVPLLPYASWVFLSRNISRILYWLQLMSACACVSLSLMRLVKQEYGEVDDTGKTNRRSALNIFYGLALAEALLFLAEKAFWEWKVSYCRLLDQVNRECDLGPSGMVSIKRFFYDAYSRCVNGSIFDGLKMDLVTFADELLASSSRDEQLIGARILLKFVTSHRFADETLRKIGTSMPVIERLIEMLNWKNPAEEEIRRSAAEIVSKLAGKKQNALRVAGIPGAMESISSLLYTGRSTHAKPDEICHRCIIADRSNYEFSAFNLLGLLILKKLANDPDNCGKIGNTRGLLTKIIDFTSAGERLGRREGVMETQIKAVQRSLQVVKMLASTSCHAGKMLRKEIAEIVFTVSNIREILQHGERHMMLQKLGIEVLTSLAMEEESRERIGSTGGVIKELLRIFLRPGLTEVQNSVRVEAGEALAMLALDSERNSNRVLKEKDVVERLVEALNDPVLRINCSRILRNLCAYNGAECFTRLRGVTTAIPTVLNAIMVKEMKLLEVSLGLAAQIFRFMSPEEHEEELNKAGVTEADFAEKLVRILKKYDYPSIKVPRMRRFVIELAIWMMKTNGMYIKLFNDRGMVKELESVAETTSELECFNVFSGSVGLSRHKSTLFSLVDIALGLIAEGCH